MDADDKLELARSLVLFCLPGFAWLAWRWRAQGRRRAGLALLSGLAVLAAILHVVRIYEHYPAAIDGYDVYQYYTVGRYHDELGLDRLYVCTVVADSELPRPRFTKISTVRNLDTYASMPRTAALRRADDCHARFTDARWAAFKQNLRFFQSVTDKEEWEPMLADLGANTSPVWQLTGGGLARLFPPSEISWALSVDTALLGGAMVLVGWAFGAETALLGTVFLLTCISSRWPPIGISLLRYDWLALSVASVCLWKKEKPALAGGALVWATGSRLFPFIFFVGVGARGLWRWGRTRALPRAEGRFALGFVGVGALLVGLALADGGAQPFRDFKEKITVHAATENITRMRVGLPIAAVWRGETPNRTEAHAYLPKKRELMAAQAPWIRGLKALAVLAVLVVARRRDLSDAGALLLGVALMPLTIEVSYYYYVLLVIPLVLHAEALPRRRAWVALSFLTTLESVGFWADLSGVQRVTTSAVGSVALCAYAVATLVGTELRGAAK